MVFVTVLPRNFLGRTPSALPAEATGVAGRKRSGLFGDGAREAEMRVGKGRWKEAFTVKQLIVL